MHQLQYLYLKFGVGILVQDKELEELLLADPNSGVYFPVSCQEYADNGATQNGSYRVQPNANISRKYILYINHKLRVIIFMTHKPVKY